MNSALRRLLLHLPLLAVLPARADQAAYDPVQPATPRSLPRDHGAHPGHRIEWWYITGWLERDATAPVGFQLTFFRVRQPVHDDNPSRFAPRQLLFAHAAVSDPARGRLLHAQKIARAGFGLAEAAVDDLDVRIDDWHLARQPAPERLLARIAADEFDYALTFAPTQPVLWQGDQGFSRKGPDPAHASHYLSWPQLDVNGRLRIAAASGAVRGRAWLDHEWSSALMPDGAQGWDWLGVNMDDGGALMAFRMRDADGHALWAAATVRDAAGDRRHAPNEVGFAVRRVWRSPRSGGAYPVELEVSVGERRFLVKPLFDDQELDSRASSGAIYWEGAVTVFDGARRIGRGYLELTGYAAALKI
ncbi:carotenoid 1,2-hydratase [Methyloversatilis discipulorum]|uniref:lipocalin-like domain-containing protein n=1 Tax=Methyloversatilis discipulorum TaxID=1119528 RepID=UPI001A3E1C77|nr:carotenoid 1,2-hydratase [Methyloversatilis discipulorum]MBL8467679.1 carotenoid 1,2-hydratase [Methyloversatilis discipulorum]